jgi:DNA-directed RNA polymerase subunit RPC12/RpoP
MTAETEFRCHDCDRWAPWTDGIEADEDEAEDGSENDEFWCQTCGSQTVLNTMESRTR